MKKAVLILNPTSGGEKALYYKEKLEKKAMEYFDTIETRITQKANDAIYYASNASKEKCESILAFGGDGTVNEVITGIAEKDYIPKLGIIPGGTGNLISRLLGINQDIDKAIEKFDFNSTSRINIGKCNKRFFGYIFSIGAISQAIHDVDIEEKTKFGPWAYVVNSMKSIINDNIFHVHIKTEKQEYEGNANHIIVLLSNLVGDKQIFSQNIDGYGNILILKDASITSKLSLIPDLIKGNLLDNEKIEYMRAKEISITSDRPLDTDLDGDIGDKLPVNIKILSRHIEVYSPKRNLHL